MSDITNTPTPITNHLDSKEEETCCNKKNTQSSCCVGKSSRNKKIIVAITLLTLIVFVIVDFSTTGFIKQGIGVFLKWVKENKIAGVFAFMGAFFLATVIFIPGALLTLGGGFVFVWAFGMAEGIMLATISVFVGACAGSTWAFFLGRYLCRNVVERLAQRYPLMEAIDVAIQDKGLRIMTLLRLSPIIPFNALNYIAGVSSISFFSNTVALLGLLPGIVLGVFLGGTASSIIESPDSIGALQVVTMVLGVVFGIFALVAVTYYAKKELRVVLQRRNEEEERKTKKCPPSSFKTKESGSGIFLSSENYNADVSGDYVQNPVTSEEQQKDDEEEHMKREHNSIILTSLISDTATSVWESLVGLQEPCLRCEESGLHKLFTSSNEDVDNGDVENPNIPGTPEEKDDQRESDLLQIIHIDSSDKNTIEGETTGPNS